MSSPLFYLTMLCTKHHFYIVRGYSTLLHINVPPKHRPLCIGTLLHQMRRWWFGGIRREKVGERNGLIGVVVVAASMKKALLIHHIGWRRNNYLYWLIHHHIGRRRNNYLYLCKCTNTQYSYGITCETKVWERYSPSLHYSDAMVLMM